MLLPHHCCWPQSGSHPAPAAAPSYSEVASRAQSFGGQSQHLTQLDANALAAVNAAGASAGGPPANYAASMAESAWPEELLQVRQPPAWLARLPDTNLRD